MMPDISTIAKLSQRNKNHSVSATSITILDVVAVETGAGFVTHSVDDKGHNVLKIYQIFFWHCYHDASKMFRARFPVQR
jgi:hypothetical protein